MSTHQSPLHWIISTQRMLQNRHGNILQNEYCIKKWCCWMFFLLALRTATIFGRQLYKSKYQSLFHGLSGHIHVMWLDHWSNKHIRKVFLPLLLSLPVPYHYHHQTTSKSLSNNLLNSNHNHNQRCSTTTYGTNFANTGMTSSDSAGAIRYETCDVIDWMVFMARLDYCMSDCSNMITPTFVGMGSLNPSISLSIWLSN